MAPSIFPDPYSNDGVDKYNHKWVALLMAVLTAMALVIPLHPSYLVASLSSLPQHPPPVPMTHPTVKAHCLCPAQFTPSYIQYTNTYCANAFNAVLRGDNDTHRVYEYRGSGRVDTDSDHIISIPLTPKPPYFDMNRQKEDRHAEREMNRQKEERHAEIKQFHRRLQKLVTFQTPMLLLVSVSCMFVSNLVWSFLSSCCGSFNVGRTLQAAKRANSLDASNRKLLYDDLCLSVTQAAQTSPNMTSTLYLTKKFLAIVVSLVLLLIVTQHNLSEVDDLSEDLNRLASPLDPRPSSGEDATVSHARDWLQHFGHVFVCHVTIGNNQMEDFKLQCAILDIKGNDASPMTLAHSMSRSWIGERNLIDFESKILKLTTAIFVHLAVGNMFSLGAWLCKLLTPSSRNAVGLSRNTPMDVVFVVQMAYLTTSADVARRLAQGSIGKNEGERASLTSSITPIR